MFARKGLVVARYIKNRRLDLCAESLRQSRTEQKLSALGYTGEYEYFCALHPQMLKSSANERTDVTL
jgi:hypothetical protein